MVFGTIAFILLLFALGYANNLVGMFVFLIISFAVTSMVIANRNMHFAKITDIHTQDLHADQDNSIYVMIENSSELPRYDFYVKHRRQKIRSALIPSLDPNQALRIQMQFRPLKRGYQKLPRFELQSYYPFQMLKTWRYYFHKEEVLVYPALKGSFELPHSEDSVNQSGEQGLFRDHKTYSAGDPIRRINWLKSNRHQELLVKNFENNKDHSYNFLWEQTSWIKDFESRISQLAFWISQCEQLGYSYSLRVGSKLLPSSKGLLHFRDCMKLLALLKEDDL